jgi:phosphoglycerate dehydrogenase-like enzyme
MKLLIQEHLLPQLGPRILSTTSGAAILPITNDGQVLGELDDEETILLRWWGLSRAGFQQIVQEAAGLRWIHTISTGVDHVLFPFLIESDIILTNARGVYDRSVAEMVVGYVLLVVKDLPRFQRLQAERRWEKAHLREMEGLTIGLVGFGGIGQQVAARARCFGMRIVAVRRHPERETPLADLVLPPDRLPELLAQSDFVAISLPFTAQTHHLINAHALAQMKPDAWLINVARGGLVDESALVQALREGHLGGACLDVFEEEPLPEDSPLWGLPNVILTPHTSGLSPRLHDRSAGLFLENLSLYVAGEPLRNIVDKRAGY